MIQFNSVSFTGSNPLNSTSNNGTQAALASFENELSNAIATTLQKFGIDPNKVSISIGSTPSSAAPSQPVAPAAVASSSTPPATAAAVDPQAAIQAADDAYWSKQPPAVQALRKMSDPDERSAAATQLMSQGFKIDVPIMMWGWDAAKVTQLRQSYGYTWVPSAGQVPVTAAPGITGVLQPYDPNNPPTGSIMV